MSQRRKELVINPMLDEERLVPTNSMRACTAVVTELSYNKSNELGQRHRTEIEVIKAAEWEKDISVCLREVPI